VGYREIVLAQNSVSEVGTYFEITDSSYLNVTLTSSEEVDIVLESIPKIVTLVIKNSSVAPSTALTFTGFEPNVTYYRYQDGSLMERFVTDSNGEYSFLQEISQGHIVFILEEKINTYIKPDGTVSPPSAPISVDGNVYTFTNDLEGSLCVQKDGITINGNGYKQIPQSGSFGIYLYWKWGVTIKNVTLEGFTYGIYLWDSGNNIIKDCTIRNNWTGIQLSRGSKQNTIIQNTISNNSVGIHVGFTWDGGWAAHKNSIIENNVSNNDVCGIWVEYANWTLIRGNTISQNNLGLRLRCIDILDKPIYHNNFVDNVNQVEIGERWCPSFKWDDGYPSGGNYWSDYTGIDEKSGPNQDQLGKDGIGDAAYVIDVNNQDGYPFMYQGAHTPVDSPTVTPTEGVTITFEGGVTSSGFTTVNITDEAPEPIMYRLEIEGYEPIKFYEIRTTADYLEGVKICITYKDEWIPPEYDEKDLTLVRFWYEDEILMEEDIKLKGYPDTVANLIIGRAEFLSWYALVLPPRIISADIDLDPNTLNLKSAGKWVTCYIEFPEGFDVEDIDISTVKISKINDEEITPLIAEAKPTGIGDHDSNGIPDLMVKFNRSTLESILSPADSVKIAVSGKTIGELDFEGDDTIRAILPGRIPDVASTKSDRGSWWSSPFSENGDDFSSPNSWKKVKKIPPPFLENGWANGKAKGLEKGKGLEKKQINYTYTTVTDAETGEVLWQSNLTFKYGKPEIPPGQAKDKGKPEIPPGQAKDKGKPEIPPGQAKDKGKPEIPPGQAKDKGKPEIPPGQEKKIQSFSIKFLDSPF